MTRRRRILYADKIIQNVVQLFCLLIFLQVRGYHSVWGSSSPVLLYSTTSDIRVLETGRGGRSTTLLQGLDQGTAVDFLHRTQRVCWSDQSAELIQCIKYNDTYIGDKVTIVSDGLITPTGIAVDWYTDKIYWADGETNRIEVISLQSKYRKVLFWSEVDLARAIAVVPSEGLMFWTDWGEVPKIERAGMDGAASTRRVIVHEDIFWPNGITVDYEAALLYWVDAKLCFIDVVDYQGGRRRRIVKSGLVYPYALTFIDNKLFWTDWQTWAIHVWDMETHGPARELPGAGGARVVPVDVKVLSGARQPAPPSGLRPCPPGACSHLCLLSPLAPGYSCACPTGVKLMEGSNSTCHAGSQAMLVVAQRSSISRISLDSPDFTPVALPLKDLKRALTVDFDPTTEYIYWADNLAKTISKARLDGSSQSVVVRSSEGLLDSIAVDALARNLYWTDRELDTISVARLDGSSRKIVVGRELYEPRALALHPAGGWMFWSDWNDKRPKIERAALDGSDRRLVVGERLAWPNGLALDTVAGRLYWGDARTHKIEVCNMDGSGRKEIQSAEILHIFGLTLLGEHLYWTDMQKRTLDRINKETGADRQQVVEQMANMMGVKAIQLGAPLGHNRCVGDNGGCSHLCFNRPHDYTCGCPLGLELDRDRKTCMEPDAFLLYSRKNIIGRISIENENNDAILPIRDLKEVSAIAVHVAGAGSKLYWSDTKTKTINRCSMDGGDKEMLLEGLGLVEGLAVDWAGQNLYWTDSGTQRIEVARLDGSSRRALLWLGLKKPKAIALDLAKGMMYWSELGARCIKRAGMDGSSAGAVFAEQTGRVQALAVDAAARALYWAALDPAALETAPLDKSPGDARVRTVLVRDLVMPFALALHNRTLFWGDWNTGLVESANKSDGSRRSVINHALDYISDMRVFERAEGEGGGAQSQCSVDNGGCAHLCLASPSTSTSTSREYRCLCPAHYRLRPDNVSCSEPEEFLLFGQKSAVGRVIGGGADVGDALLPLHGLASLRALDYDPLTKMLYWMEDNSTEIRRVPVSYSSTSVGTDSSVVVADVGAACSMVLDVLGRTLYWTRVGGDSINATSVQAGQSSSGVVVRAPGSQPRHLAFHQTMRVLVWSDAGLGGVMRSDVEGGARTLLAHAHNVTALALDQASGTVYYARQRQIHAVELDATNQRVVWQGGWVGSLAALAGWLYLVGRERTLMRLALPRGDAPAPAVPLTPHVTRVLHLRQVNKVSVSHPCYMGGACGGGAATCGAAGLCGCGLRCPRPVCEEGHLLCDSRCISPQWRCDGQRDCEDGADEVGCGLCAGGVRCNDGSCGAGLGACKTGASCALQPLQLAHAFRCDAARLCLAPALLCDGYAHCRDASDEAPPACERVRGAEGVGAGGARRWSAVAVCACAASAAAAAAGALLLLRRRRRARRPDRPPPASFPLCPTKPRLPVGPTHLPSKTDTSTSASAESSSLGGRYPRPTLNPPPSPATGGGGGSGGGGGGGGRRRAAAYRHYRAINRPPPPTPASTDADACESEPEPAMAPPPSPAAPLTDCG